MGGQAWRGNFLYYVMDQSLLALLSVVFAPQESFLFFFGTFVPHCSKNYDL